jgi:uncharacterized Zn finger protein
MSFWGFRPYVSVAQRQAKAAKQIAKLKKQGRAVSPVITEGRKIATSFWGKAWCDNLERYSDFDNRLPRGRSYVNNGLVIDLKLTRGKVEALVSGSELYTVKIEIAVAAPARWTAICSDCAGSVGSIVELLQGKLSKNVMERVCRDADGLFPAPKEITMSCSCPDWADMCKHVAATLYAVGARLDRDPDLLFTLRGVDRSALVSTGADMSITEMAAGSERVLAGDDVAALFGLTLEAAPPAAKAGKTAPIAIKAEPVARPVPKGRAATAGDGPRPQVRQKSSAKAGPTAADARASAGGRRATAAPSGREVTVSGGSALEAERAGPAKAARRSDETPSPSSAGRKPASNRATAKREPASSAATRKEKGKRMKTAKTPQSRAVNPERVGAAS